MKYVYGLVMILALVGMVFAGFLGMSYEFQGHGLHPALASLAAIGFLYAGYIAALMLEGE